MADKLDELIQTFSGFEGKVTESLDNIKNDIKEIKENNKDRAKEYWDNINKMNERIVTTHTELKVIKGKWSVYAGAIATAITLFIHWIKSKW
jgi:flagellar capping protein FliD